MGLAEIMSFLKPGITRQFPQDTAPEAEQQFYNYPPAMPAEDVERLLTRKPGVKLSKPARQDFPGLLPKFVRSNGPTVDARTQQPLEYNIPPSQSGPAPAMESVTSNPALLNQQSQMSRIEQIRNALGPNGAQSPSQAADIGEITGQAQGYNTIRPSGPEPYRISEQSRTGMRYNPQDRFERMRILNEQERNAAPKPSEPATVISQDNYRSLMTPILAERERLAAGRKDLVDRGILPEKVAQVPQAVPVPGGQTDTYNQMKAAQRANQLANQANAPNLIMAREQLRNYGPRGAVMMKMLGGGQGGSDPTILAAAGMDGAASAELAKRGLANQVQIANGRSTENAIQSYLEGGGDPGGIPALRQMLAGGQPVAGARPSATAPLAPGVKREHLDSLISGYDHPEVNAEINDLVTSQNLNTGVVGIDQFGWEPENLKPAVMDAARKLVAKYGITQEQAMNAVKSWYQKRRASDWFGVPHPDAVFN
jgi:hypothetical protein